MTDSLLYMSGTEICFLYYFSILTINQLMIRLRYLQMVDCANYFINC